MGDHKVHRLHGLPDYQTDCVIQRARFAFMCCHRVRLLTYVTKSAEAVGL